MRGGIATAIVAVSAIACAHEPPASGAPARLSVEILRGFSAADVAPHQITAPVVVLLDATRSMLGITRHGASHYVAAQRAATRFANDVPAPRPLWLYAIGAAEAADCQPVSRAARAETAAARGALLEEILAVQARGEGALSTALDGVREELWRSDALLGSRVVVFSDFSSDCGGDVCTAAAKLIAGGARLDFVAIGETQAPACLREPTGLAESLPPPPTLDRPLHFRLEVSQPEPMVVGCSDVGGLPIAAPAGRGTVVVELDPPLRVEAYFAPGRKHVLQILDFPTLDPPARHWRWLDAPPAVGQPGSEP